MANTKKYVSLDKLSLYDEKIKKVISDSDATALQSAKDYADGLASNYDAAGSAASAEAAAKAYADGLAGNYDAAGSASAVEGKLTEEIARAKAAEEANAAAAKKAQDEVDALELKVQNIEENAYDDTEIRGLISGLDTNKADKTQVATDIADAVKAEEDARKAAVEAVQGEVDALEQTHATDKATLEGAIALKADKTALEAVSGVANAAATKEEFDAAVEALEAEDVRIAGLVSAEAQRAAGVEAGLEERLVEVETFFKTADGETIDQAMDTLVEIQKYITEDGAAADQMVKDIAANKKAIEDHVATDHDFGAADEALEERVNAEIAKKADKTTVEGIAADLDVAEGKIEVVEGKVSTLEGEMDAVEAAVATKAEAKALTDAVTALEGVDAGQETRIAALEAKFGDGEGNVEDMIADAKQEAIDTAAEDATTKANKAKDDAIAKANELNTAMNTRVEALEAIDHDHSNKAELDLIASGDKAKWDAAASIAHSHDNKTVLDGITSAKVTAWDSAEGNAKTYADGLNTAMDTRVNAIETWHANFVEVSEEEINALFV